MSDRTIGAPTSGHADLPVADSGSLGDEPLSVSTQARLARFLSLDRLLADITLDQLRTLVLVREVGSALKASHALGREQSSIQKQLDALNRQFERACGERLVHKQGRGKDFLFTPTAHALAAWSESVLAGLITQVDFARQRLGRGLRVGTTEFTLGYLARVWPLVKERFLELDVEVTLIHVRTKQFWQMLNENKVDLLCGGVLAQNGHPIIGPEYEFLEFSRDSVALLSNLSPDELDSSPPVTPGRFQRLPLVVPESGIIVDFVRGWFGEEYRKVLHIVAEIDDIYYGLALLRLRLVRGVMIILDSISEALKDDDLTGTSGATLRKIPLANSFEPPLELVSGVVTRKGDRTKYSLDHPLNVLWEALVDVSHISNNHSGLTPYGRQA